MSFSSFHIQHNERVLKELRIGDMVKFDRDVFRHWKVYVGEENIVNLTAPGNGWFSGISFIGNATVRMGNFWKVASGCKAKKDNEKDKIFSPRSAMAIRRDALNWVGKIVYMHFLWNNCEHFASKLRYGEDISTQGILGSILLGSAAVVVGGVYGALATGFYYLISQRKKKRACRYMYLSPSDQRYRGDAFAVKVIEYNVLYRGSYISDYVIWNLSNEFNDLIYHEPLVTSADTAIASILIGGAAVVVGGLIRSWFNRKD